MTASVGNPLLWTLFVLGVGALLALDLGVFHRKAHAVSPREALAWSTVWVSLSLLFDLWIWSRFGSRPALEFLAGYVIEYALSVDNIFVFIVIFGYFRVPARLQHRVLFWGIVGAVALRALFIGLGAALLARFHWIIYLFGVFLVFTGFKILRQGDPEVDPAHNPVLRLIRRLLPITSEYHEQAFFIRQGGRLFATPLLAVLVVIEATDVVFAVDSIPAIFGVTQDPFIVFTSNICAVLGLRSLYFLLASAMDRFHYLSVGLGLVLVFIGGKMLASGVLHVPIEISLAIVAVLLGGAMLVSWLRPVPPPAIPELPPTDDETPPAA